MVSFPIPLRQSAGAMKLARPPAPMQTTSLAEYFSWSNPAIFFWRSSAPGIVLPRSSIDVGEPVNIVFMLFYSLSINFNLKGLVETKEPRIAIAAEDRSDRHVSGTLQTLLEILIYLRA